VPRGTHAYAQKLESLLDDPELSVAEDDEADDAL
jgi:hypothetical protein